MTTEYSLISVHFKRLDKKDNVLIHWNILPSGASTIVKGELLEDNVEVKSEWKDERYSANRGLRLFGVVKQAMLKEHGMLPKKVPKKPRQPHAAQPIIETNLNALQDIVQNPEPTSEELLKQVEELIEKAESLKEKEDKAAEEAKLKEEEVAKNKGKEGASPFELLTVKELKGVLELRGATYPPKATKAQLIDLIQVAK